MPCGIAAGVRELEFCCQEEEKLFVSACGCRVFVFFLGCLGMPKLAPEPSIIEKLRFSSGGISGFRASLLRGTR